MHLNNNKKGTFPFIAQDENNSTSKDVLTPETLMKVNLLLEAVIKTEAMRIYSLVQCLCNNLATNPLTKDVMLHFHVTSES